jgi:hypothetical protein
VAETPPTLTISPVGHGNVIDDSVARAVGGVAIGGTVAGLAAGATFQVAVTDGSFTGIYTATVDSTGARWNAVMPKSDATVLANGTATVSAQATDAYGNVSVRVADAVSVKLTGTATGDVHMVTYDGLRYDFQAVGTFVLTRSTTPGDDFQIQIQTSPYPLNHAASVTTRAAAQLGGDVLLFDPGAKDFISVDGAADSTLGAADPTQIFAAGKLVKVSSSEYQVQWNSGETLTLFDRGYYIDTSVALGPRNGPGSVQGLLGPDNGQANDFQLPNGSVLAQPLSRSELYGAFANAWSVTTSDSLFGDAAATSAATGATPLKLVDSPNGHDVLEATSQGETLTATSGGVILSDARELGATFAGTLPVLSSDLISGFSSKDSIDVFGVNGADTTLSYAGSSAMGVLTVSEGSQAGELYLSGALSGGSFHVSSDGTGGARITFG